MIKPPAYHSAAWPYPFECCVAGKLICLTLGGHHGAHILSSEGKMLK